MERSDKGVAIKRTISSFLGLLLISVPLFASTVKVVSSTANNLTVEVSLPEVEFTEREYPDGNIYTVLRVHGSGTWEIGNPAVPCFGNWILIPNGTSVHITTYPGEPVIYENISLPPVQPPLPDLKDAPIPPFVKNQETYKANRDYPGEFAIVEPVKQMRGQDCTILWLLPYQYNPVSRILRVYPDLRVSIDFKGIARPIPSNLRSRQYERKMLGMAINAKEVLEFQKSLEGNEQNKSKSTGGELLIITHDDFETAANTLSDWRTKTGILTRVAKTSVIGNTTTDIESYIDNAVANWSPAPEYLLLLGDAEFVPTWYENLHPWHNTFTGTDIFYADINIPPDYIADLGYGRLPVDTPAEADSLVARIIRYEKIANPNSYYTNVTMATAFKDGSLDPPDSIADRRFAKTSEDVGNYLNRQGYTPERVYTTHNVYDNSEIYPKYWNNLSWAVFENDTAGGEIPSLLQNPFFPWNATTLDVSDAINNGTFFLLHRGHGGRNGWARPHFRNWDVDALNNGEQRPIVFSINCNTGWFDNETDDPAHSTGFYSECFIEHWLRHPTGGGIGLIAASRVSWSGINDRLVWGWMDAIWPDFLTWSNDPYGGPERIYTMGGVLNYGKAYMRTKYHFNDVIRATLEGFHWFGDPTMVIWTAIPEMMVVSYPLEVPLGPGNFTVYVENASTLSPVESTWVCVMKGDEVYERGFTDALGNITFSISPSTVGTLWVTTRAENYITNQGSALVVYNYGDVAPMAILNPPDTVFVDSTYLPEVWIMNMGTDTIPIFDVICTIDTSGVPVYIDTQSISNIAGGDSAFVTFAGWTVPLAREDYKVTVFTSGVFLVDTVPLNDTMDIVVYEYNDAPSVAGLPDTSFLEDDTLYIDLDDYVSDSDDPDSVLNWSYSIYVKNRSLIASLKKIGTSGPIYVDIDTITHIATIAAAPNWSGTRNIVFTAEDPWSLTDADTITVTVLSVNDPPVIDSVIPVSPCTILIDSVLSLRVFANDVEGDSLSYDWSINGVFDTTTIDPIYSYTSSVQVIDTVMVEASDGVLKDSTQWIVVVIDPTAIEEIRDIPDKFVLFTPRPNPSAGVVEIEYGLPEKADILLTIYDIQGRLVDLVYRGKKDAGYHKLKIDSRDLSSGIYFIRFQTPKFTEIEKLIVLQ